MKLQTDTTSVQRHQPQLKKKTSKKPNQQHTLNAAHQSPHYHTTHTSHHSRKTKFAFCSMPKSSDCCNWRRSPPEMGSRVCSTPLTQVCKGRGSLLVSMSTTMNGGRDSMEGTITSSAAEATSSPSQLLHGSSSAAGVVFEELLDAEVTMNLARLREASRQGIPPEYRCVVYRFLLGVTSMDKSSEMTVEQMLEEDFHMLESVGASLNLGSVRATSDVSSAMTNPLPLGATTSGAGVGVQSSSSVGVGGSGTVASRNLGFNSDATVLSSGSGPIWDAVFQSCRSLKVPSIGRGSSGGNGNGSSGSRGSSGKDEKTSDGFRGPLVTNTAEFRKALLLSLRALSAVYLQASHEEADAIFHIAKAMATIGKTASDVFHLTHALVSLLRAPFNPLHDVQTLSEYSGMFLMLFHSTNEPLYSHFQQEDVPFHAYVMNMYRSCLAKQLHPVDFLRLMDTYLTDGSELGCFPLHTFVCLSVLSMFTEELMEMDGMQIVVFLRRLPRMDVEAVLQRALSLRESVLSRDLL